MCSARGTAVIDDPAAIVGDSPSIAIPSDGVPIIASETTNGFRITRCTTLTCAAGTGTTVVLAVSTGFTNVVIGSDQLPVVVSRDGGSIRATHCATVTCTTFATINAGGTSANPGIRPQVSIGPDGMPLLVVQAGGAVSALLVIHCSNTFCTPFSRRN